MRASVASRAGAKILHPGLPRYGQGSLDVRQRFLGPPRLSMQFGAEAQRLCLEPRGAELEGEVERRLRVRHRRLELHQRMMREEGAVPGDGLGPQMADPRRVGDRGPAFGEAEPGVAAEDVGQRQHRPVGRGDPCEALAHGKLDAGREAVAGASHPPAHVFGVAEPAQRGDFRRRIPGLPRECQRALVFAKAAGEVAPGKQEVAAQEVDARGDLATPRGGGHRAGPVEVGEGAFEIVGEALHGGGAEQCLGPFRVARGEGEKGVKGLSGLCDGALLQQPLGTMAREGVALARLAREGEPALGVGDGAVVAVGPGLGPGGIEIGERGGGVLGPVEMRGTECRIAGGEPRGGTAMEDRTLGARQREIGALGDDGVGEEMALGHRAEETLLDQPFARRRPSEHRLEGLWLHDLAEHRCGLEDAPARLVELVHPRLDHAVHGPRQLVRARSLLPKQVLEEERVAARPLDAADDARRDRAGDPLGEPGRVLVVERPEVDGEDRAARAAQGGGRMVGEAARRRDEDAGAADDGRADRADELDRRRPCPVQVLHDDERRADGRRAADHPRERVEQQALARADVERGEGRLQPVGELLLHQMEEEGFPVRGNEARGDGPFDGRDPGGAIPGRAEQAADDGRDGGGAAGLAEVEDAADVASEALRFGGTGELFDEPGLADAGLAADQDDLAPRPVADSLQRARQLGELAVPADERRAPDGAFGEALDGERPEHVASGAGEGAGAGLAARREGRLPTVFGDEDLAARCEAREQGGELSACR